MDGALLPFLLITLGLALLVVEVFIPSGGLITILSILALIFGVVLVFRNYDSTTGLITVVGLFVAIPILVGVAFQYWPHTKVGKLMMLQGPEPEDSGASFPEETLRAVERLIGQVGKTVTPLRPSGVTLIQGHRVDTKTEGLFVDAGQWVRVIDVRGGQVTVRPLGGDEIEHLQDLGT